jgi:uncharacterized damage-inducible protein DinB
MFAQLPRFSCTPALPTTIFISSSALPRRRGSIRKHWSKSTTDKARIIATLKASYAHAKAAIRAMPDSDLEKTLDWNGGKITERGVLLFIVQHIAQHLGQQIAYARSIGVVPPWTTDSPRKN